MSRKEAVSCSPAPSEPPSRRSPLRDATTTLAWLTPHDLGGERGEEVKMSDEVH